MSELYRIGEFAEKVGVTPDWLKYYEKQGLIQTQVAPNGYRYYAFNQGSYIASFLELKNIGFQTDDIVRILHSGSFHELIETTSSKLDDLSRQIDFSKAMLRKLKYWKECEPLFSEKDNWNIRTMEGFYFLPTSNRNHFVNDKRIWPIRRDWNRWLPVVDTTQRIFIPQDYDTVKRFGPAKAQWGISMPIDFAHSINAQMEDPVIYVPPCRCLEMYCRVQMDIVPDDPNKVMWPGASCNNSLPYVLPVLEKHHFRISGTCYCHRLIKLWEDGHPVNYNVIYVPIES